MATAEKKSFLQTTTEYQGALTYDGHDTIEPRNVDSSRSSKQSRVSKKSLWMVLVTQIACLAWIAPAIYLLNLNFQKHVSGASAWCPKHKCWVDAFNNDTTAVQDKLNEFARYDHNFNNIMQYAAKGLEIWFGIIAGAFMYVLVMCQSFKRPLQVRFLPLANEFPDLTTFSKRSLWTAAGDFRIWLILLALFLGLLSNLMGPATATLVLPTLKWVQTPHISQGYFDVVDSNNFPGANGTDGFILADSGCSKHEIENLQYSCSSKWASTLDSWASSMAGITPQLSSINETGPRALSIQGPLSLYYNTTRDWLNVSTRWVPSRQLLNQLSNDLSIVANMSQGVNATGMNISDAEYHDYTSFNNSLQLQLQRSGPILGALPNVNLGTMFPITINDTYQIYCFPDYSLQDSLFQKDGNNFTKCIPRGPGWPTDILLGWNMFQIQTAGEASDNSTDRHIDVEIMGSSRAVLLPNGSTEATIASKSLPAACFGEGPVPPTDECDWAYFFSGEYNIYSSEGAFNFMNTATSFVNTIMFSQTLDNSATMLAVDYVALLGYTNYTLDPWPLNNPLRLVQTPALREDIALTPIAIHPSWTFAAMSVDWSGNLNSSIPANRTFALLCQKAFTWAAGTTDIYNDDFRTGFGLLEATLYTPILQTLSLIGWRTRADDKGNPDVNVELTLNARTYVWAYGFDSKTAKLGAAVAIAGCFIAVLHTCVGLFYQEKRRDLTQLLLAALAHNPDDEEHNADSVMHFQDREHSLGGLTFERKKRA